MFHRRDLLVATAFATLTAVFAVQAAAEPVSLATEASYPPFSKTEPDGSFTGFELDLGNEVCKRAGFQCTWVKQDFDGAIAALQARKFDVIFSSMSIKPERQRVADFSLPYYSDSSSVIGRKGGLKTIPGDLAGKKVGVYGGSTQEQFARARFAGAEIRPYQKIDNITADLVAGRIDAMFVESLPAQEFLASANGSAFERAGEALKGPELGAGAGAMFRKGDQRKAKVDAALRAIYADGTFDRLQQKWFPASTNIRADYLW